MGVTETPCPKAVVANSTLPTLSRLNKMPVALNITGKCYDDANVLNIAYSLEKQMDYKNQIAKEN